MVFAREKREHLRIPAKLPLKYRLIDDSPQKYRQVQSMDFSAGGMSFRNPEFIPHRTKALVEFTPPNRSVPIRIVSEVVRTRGHYAGSHFTIGIRFQHMLK